MLLQNTVSQQSSRRPEAVAIVAGDVRITYRQLEERSNQLAHLLVTGGCKIGDRICILLPKSVPAIVGMLGALKAGGIYVPLDTRSPASRLAKIIEKCRPALVLASSSSADLLRLALSAAAEGGSPHVGWLDSVDPPSLPTPVIFRWPDLSRMPSTATGIRLNPEAPAHILFTSGSTGMPKGVVITHSNVSHFLHWAVRYFGTAETDRISCHPPLHFDLSTFDIYGTFLAGAQLHLVPPEASLLPHKLADFIRESQLTQWFSVPSALRYMAQFDAVPPNSFPALKRVLWCGEALPVPTLIYWMNQLPQVKFTNLYGPTETTIASSYYTVPKCPEGDTAAIPIGTACDGEELLVLNESLEPAASDEIGDLYIRGAGLSPGYWEDEEKTQAAFLSRDGVRMYKTGDLAKLGSDGLIYLLGRNDSQIKSRGYRIELGEIEAALYSLGNLRECAVVAVPSDNFEGMTICCAYVPAAGLNAQPSELRKELGELVPPYMLPSRWMALESLPLNGNGKIDRPRVKEQFLMNTAFA